MLEVPPLSLYVHIPWCIRKCPYCDFNSHPTDGALPQRDYIAALCEDFDDEVSRYEALQGREIETIFIGGGTPSLFDASSFETLLDHLSRKATLSRDIEISLEANPGSVEANALEGSNRFKQFRAAGINRLSLGIQSFSDKHLSTLGRIHDGKQARMAIDSAQAAGFNNLNLDLMHGLPDQSVESALADLQTAIDYKPDHLSWYQLTIEPNTVFYRKPPPLPAENQLLEIQQQGIAILEGNGFTRYEVSAFAQEQRQCIHNLNYWQFGDYLGIGAGAHGKLSNPSSGIILRSRKLKQPEHYLHNTVNRAAERVEIKPEDRVLEFLLNALRIRQGFPIDLFENRTDLPFDTIRNKVEYLASNGLLSIKDSSVITTEIGYRLLNSILEEFV
ncbi:MAG TPA: YggW family oxidoreductase [Gammaproteobacteria bacterium]|nr:YggW family oxidoreductase [Gammaproteobacteria bacterium]